MNTLEYPSISDNHYKRTKFYQKISSSYANVIFDLDGTHRRLVDVENYRDQITQNFAEYDEQVRKILEKAKIDDIGLEKNFLDLLTQVEKLCSESLTCIDATNKSYYGISDEYYFQDDFDRIGGYRNINFLLQFSTYMKQYVDFVDESNYMQNFIYAKIDRLLLEYKIEDHIRKKVYACCSDFMDQHVEESALLSAYNTTLLHEYYDKLLDLEYSSKHATDFLNN